MSVIYRRPKTVGYKRWHHTQRCRDWPRRDFEERRYAPPTHDVCRECRRLVGDGYFPPTGKGGWF